MMLFRSTKQTGDIGEDAAVKFLKKKGYKTVARNFRTPHGELDIIAENKEYIVFAEVKTRDIRRDSKYGKPSDAVNKAKQRRIIYSAKLYLSKHPSNKKQRLDVIEVLKSEDENGKITVSDINHIENAFGG